jgi:energy-converting hydrogenase A subunit R
MNLIPDGEKIFEVISHYDDILTMEGRKDYEPGDTLALIVPFLILHHIHERDIIALAQQSRLINGTEELLAFLKLCGWQIFCITTTYQQYAHYITGKLGIPVDNVASTIFPLDNMSRSLSPEESNLLYSLEKEILALYTNASDAIIKEKLDAFFFEKLTHTHLGRQIKAVKPIGGQRKLDALQKFSDRYQQPLNSWVVVADSITDFKMLDAVKIAGGLAIAFNANKYALPLATMSLASTHLSDLKPVLETWQSKGLEGVHALVTQQTAANNNPGLDARANFHWLMNQNNIEEVIDLHSKLRHMVRKKAGRLG